MCSKRFFLSNPMKGSERFWSLAGDASCIPYELLDILINILLIVDETNTF